MHTRQRQFLLSVYIPTKKKNDSRNSGGSVHPTSRSRTEAVEVLHDEVRVHVGHEDVQGWQPQLRRIAGVERRVGVAAVLHQQPVDWAIAS